MSSLIPAFQTRLGIGYLNRFSLLGKASGSKTLHFNPSLQPGSIIYQDFSLRHESPRLHTEGLVEHIFCGQTNQPLSTSGPPSLAQWDRPVDASIPRTPHAVTSSTARHRILAGTPHATTLGESPTSTRLRGTSAPLSTTLAVHSCSPPPAAVRQTWNGAQLRSSQPPPFYQSPVFTGADSAGCTRPPDADALQGTPYPLASRLSGQGFRGDPSRLAGGKYLSLPHSD